MVVCRWYEIFIDHRGSDTKCGSAGAHGVVGQRSKEALWREARTEGGDDSESWSRDVSGLGPINDGGPHAGETSTGFEIKNYSSRCHS